MKSLFYTSLIVAGALLMLITFVPRGEVLHLPNAPVSADTRGASASGKDDSRATPAAARRIPPSPTEARVESLEELTRNWTVIPASAFPRKVKLLREASFRSGVGASKLPAGSTVVALACDKGILSLAPDESSPVRGMTRVGDTDLKTQFNDSYAKWAAERLEALRELQARRLREELPAPVAIPGGVDDSGRPVRGPDGTYPVLVASMRSGQVTDITPNKVKMWGAPQLATMEGRPTWVIDVNYDTIVFCGPIEARAQAHVRDGKVVRWVYPGSGEPVP